MSAYLQLVSKIHTSVLCTNNTEPEIGIVLLLLLLLLLLLVNWPKTFANKNADYSAHSCSLISIFVVPCLSSKI